MGKDAKRCIKLLVSEDWLRMAMSEFGEEGLCCKGTNDMLSGIVSGIRARVGKKGIFKRLRAETPWADPRGQWDADDQGRRPEWSQRL